MRRTVWGIAIQGGLLADGVQDSHLAGEKSPSAPVNTALLDKSLGKAVASGLLILNAVCDILNMLSCALIVRCSNLSLK